MEESYLLGVMQGRLLPKYQGRYQAHPVGYWQEEFPIASKLGLKCIEFILDYNDVEENPLMQEAGLDEILELSEQTGILVKTVCADYFMEAPLHSPSDIVVQQSQKVLCKLITHSARIGISDIVIPCIEQSSLVNNTHTERFVNNLQPAIELAEKFGINLSLETDLNPDSFVVLLEQFDSHRITVNYDTGNSASLGYNVEDEISVYGRLISDIHIKDRVSGGESVMLGNGNTAFDTFFSELAKINSQSVFIMQAYRDEEGLGVFNKQLEWVKPKLDSFWREKKELLNENTCNYSS
jgi:L-ribulose-5-phosphate 3-epimerase